MYRHRHQDKDKRLLEHFRIYIIFCTTPLRPMAKLERAEARGMRLRLVCQASSRDSTQAEGAEATATQGQMDRQMPFSSGQKLCVYQHQAPVKRPDRQNQPKGDRAAKGRRGATTDGPSHLLGTRPGRRGPAGHKSPQAEPSCAPKRLMPKGTRAGFSII